MTCKECKKLIIKYTYDKINARERKRMEKHITNCDSCWSELFRCNRLMKLVSSLPELQTSPFFESSLKAKLSQAKPAKEPIQWFNNIRFALAGVISLALILIFSFYLYKGNHENDDLQALTTFESELIKYSRSEGNNVKHFIMPSIKYYENSHSGIDNYNEVKNYILTSVKTSDESNYILDKIIIYQNESIKH